MGTINHDAIVVTTYNAEDENDKERQHVDIAINKARSIGLTVIGPDPEEVNGTQTFLICPDGSNEGWETSNEFDRKRAEFIKWLKAERYQDGLSCFDWVAIRYGECEPVITDSEFES